MTNKQIRKHARARYGQNICRFLLAFALVMLPSCISFTVSGLMRSAGWWAWGSAAVFVITVLAYPFILGGTSFFFNGFHGIPGPVKDLARFYCGKKHVTNALVLGFMMTAVNTILSNANSWLGLLAEKYLPEPLAAVVRTFVSMIVPLALLGILIFWMFRIFLIPYIYIGNPERKPLDMIKESFQKIKGYAPDLFVFSVSVFWLPFALIIMAFIIALSITIATEFAFSTTMLLALTYLILLSFGPYIQLSMAGFAAGLLSDDPKKRLKKPDKHGLNAGKYRYKTDWSDPD